MDDGALLTPAVYFHKLVVEGVIAEGGGHVIAPGAVTNVSFPCPVRLDTADGPEVGYVASMRRVPGELVFDQAGRFGSCTWVWQGWAPIPGRSRDEVECLVRDYRPRGWVVGDDEEVDDGCRMMFNGTLVGVTLVRGTLGDPVWSICDGPTWASSNIPGLSWSSGSFKIPPPFPEAPDVGV